MRIRRMELDNFRCFGHVELEFGRCRDPEAASGGDGPMVIVAANGQGKTAVLEALRYLLGSFLSRFPKVSVPRPKDSDYRDTWSAESGPDGTEFHLDRRAPFMRLYAEADGPAAAAGDGSRTCWDIHRKRDKSSRTLREVPAMVGSRRLWRQADWFLDHDNDGDPVPVPVIAYYDTQRAVVRSKPDRRGGLFRTSGRYHAYAGALDGGLNYGKTIEWLCLQEDRQRRGRERARAWDYRSLEQRTIQAAVEKMLPGFRNLRTVLEPLDLQVDVADEAAGVFRTCRIDSQLSDGHRIVLALVLDLVRRILEANACVADIDPDRLLASEGVVLIDEVDLHLHPSWQQRILPDLERTFPRIQFIVTTHSPQVVASVPRSCVRILSGGEALSPDMPTQGVDIGDILAGIFGTDPIPLNTEIARQYDLLQAMTAEGLGDTEDWRRLYGKLENYYGKDYPPLLGARDHRDFLRRMKGGRHAYADSTGA